MSATTFKDTVSYGADPPASAMVTTSLEVEIASCDCCGMKDEYTLGYIEKIRGRYEGKWLCGLCAAAVDDEIVRSERIISSDEALRRHLNVCQQFSCSSLPPDPTGGLITAMKQILIKGLDSPKSPRSAPCSPTNFKKNEAPMVSPSLGDSPNSFGNISLEER